MESEHNNKGKNENKINIEKNKLFTVSKQYSDDSETYENSSKYKAENSEKNNSSLDEFNKYMKKSLGFLKKNIYIENPEPETKILPNRKYSMEDHLIIKDFVPQLKPIEIHLVPSKLRLNKKGFKDLKCNKDNKILLLSNNYFISCPNSEEESDMCISPQKNYINDKNEDIKSTRKILQKMKSGSLPKVMSKNVIESNCKLYKDDLKIEVDSDNDLCDLDDDNLLLYDDNDFINYNISPNGIDNNKNKKENEREKVVRKNRINSCSILDVLKNRLSFDETN